jgi:hypothetical protein
MRSRTVTRLVHHQIGALHARSDAARRGCCGDAVDVVMVVGRAGVLDESTNRAVDEGELIATIRGGEATIALGGQSEFVVEDRRRVDIGNTKRQMGESVESHVINL